MLEWTCMILKTDGLFNLLCPTELWGNDDEVTESWWNHSHEWGVSITLRNLYLQSHTVEITLEKIHSCLSLHSMREVREKMMVLLCGLSVQTRNVLSSKLILCRRNRLCILTHIQANIFSENMGYSVAFPTSPCILHAPVLAGGYKPYTGAEHEDAVWF